MRKIVKNFILAWIIMFALTRSLPDILDVNAFEDTVGYIIQSIYVLLGEYDLSKVFILIMISMLLYYIKQDNHTYKNYRICSILFAMILTIGQSILHKHGLFLSVFGVLTCLFRNNGLYMILLTYLIYMIVYLVKRDKKEVYQTGKLCLFLVMGYFIIQTIFTTSLHATQGSSRELFSLPFQITARYLQIYHDEITLDEEIVIENILGDIDLIRSSYDPTIADPVKNLYRDSSVTTSDLIAYFKVFVMQFLRHPVAYIEGILIHINGWFNPTISNSIRYEVVYDKIYTGGIIDGSSKLILFIYRFLSKITPIAILETPGFYTWLLLYLTAYKVHKKQQIITIVPQWIALLICMISPCFLLHPRYALPIMFTMPFILGYILTERKGDSC